jgi:hypothetical protein
VIAGSYRPPGDGVRADCAEQSGFEFVIPFRLTIRRPEVDGYRPKIELALKINLTIFPRRCI